MRSETSPGQKVKARNFDIERFVRRATHEIWNQKSIGKIYDYYVHNVVTHTGSGDRHYGRDYLVTEATQWLAAFPGTQVYVNDLIWSVDEDNYMVSIRYTITAHYTGPGTYGVPTGEKVVINGIANYRVGGDRIVEGWVEHDKLGLLRQLGLDESEFVSATEAYGNGASAEETWGEVERGIGQEPPQSLPQRHSERFDIEDFVRRSAHEIFNRRMVGMIDEYYTEDYLCHGASGRELLGTEEYKAEVLTALAAFPDATFHVDHLIQSGDEQNGYKTSAVWTMLGTHAGPSIYGPATGRRVKMTGITNHLVKDGKFVEEWTEFDELGLMRQLYVARTTREAMKAEDMTGVYSESGAANEE